MKGLKKVLPILKLGATSETYPPFGSYLISDGKTLRTWNSDIYVEIDYSVPFIGAINIYVLDNILKSISDDAIVKQESSIFNIKDENFNANIDIIETVDISVLEKPSVDTIEITEEVLNYLKLANKFIGGVGCEDKYQYVYIGNSFICATDRSRVFLKSLPKIETPISLNKKMLSSLIVGTKLGSDRENILIDYDIGFLLAQTHLVSEFPIKDIVEYVKECGKGVKKLCNIAVVQDALKKLSPIFYGEKDTEIVVNIDKGNLRFNAESTLNGSIQLDYETNIREECSITINPNYFKDIPIDYDVFVDTGIQKMKRVYLSNTESEIVLLGKGE